MNMRTNQYTYQDNTIEQVIYDEYNHLLESCYVYDEIDF